MVIDTSAIVAALAGEPQAERIRAMIVDTDECLISAFSVFECRAVLTRRFPIGMGVEFEALMAVGAFDVVPFDRLQADLAHSAFRRYGKGMGHPAQLNLGDCAAYALAMSRGLPLLFVGNDFSRTDVTPALPP